jgi:hypothetical protein
MPWPARLFAEREPVSTTGSVLFVIFSVLGVLRGLLL